MTLREVARLAGVSRTTVSLVANNIKGSRVSPKTKKRVLAVIEKLNYKPNPNAQRLALRKTHSIGLFNPYAPPMFSNSTNIEMIGGIQEVADEKGYNLVLFSNGKKYRDLNQASVADILENNAVDGIIISNTRFTTSRFIDNVIKHIRKYKTNATLIEYYWGDDEINYVGLDNEQDIYLATDYLMQLGHRQMALLAGPEQALVTARIVAGYKRALVEKEVAFDIARLAYADYDYDRAYEMTRAMLERDSRLTAFVVGGYEMAPACLKAVKDTGLRVPEDVSIMVYVDHESFAYLEPPLTAVKLPYYEMGRRGAQLLFEPEDKKRQLIMKTELVVRASTAPVP